ncbi:MAG: hypothetical protein EOO88_55880, partial [Pedobacter sp.]
MKNTYLKMQLGSVTSLRYLCLSLLAFCMLLPASVMAQTGTIGIGTGTANGSTNLPITSNWGYSYSQQIVTASEFVAGGGAAGQITKVRFYVNTVMTPVTTWNNWTVYVGHTTKATFASATDWEPVANLTEVFTGTITPVAANWMEITFTTPFTYDGTSNLIVAVDENSADYSSGASSFGSYTGVANQGIYYRSDTVNPNPTTPPSATGRLATLARIQFVGTLQPCVAPTNLTSAAASATTATVSFTASGSNPGQGYQYYYSETNTAPTTSTAPSGTIAAGATTATIPGLTANTPYFVWVRSNCGTDGFSAWVSAGTFTTLCTPAPITYTSDFNAATIPACWSRQLASATQTATKISFVTTATNLTATP